MNKYRKLVRVVPDTILITLAGCKPPQETAEAEKFTRPEGVTMMSETVL